MSSVDITRIVNDDYIPHYINFVDFVVLHPTSSMGNTAPSLILIFQHHLSTKPQLIY